MILHYIWLNSFRKGSEWIALDVDCSIFFFFEIIFPIIIKSVKSYYFIILLKIRDQFAFKFLNCKILT